MAFDNLCKLLAEQHPDRFAAWLLGVPEVGTVEVLKTELGLEPIRADSVTFIRADDRILHLEFQTRWKSRPPIPFRMLEYWTRLYRIYALPIVQVVVVLIPPSDKTVIEDWFRSGNTQHHFNVVKMWEEPTAFFLEDPILLPFATLTQTESADRLLNQVAHQVERLAEPDQRRQISSYVQLMAGLKYDKDTVRRLFSEDIMRESVIYQEIFQEGKARGIAQGEARGEARGIAQGEARGEARGIAQGERLMVVRVLSRRFGDLAPGIRSQLDALSIDHIEALGEAMVEFTTIADLAQWLDRHGH
jgi:predicted transposase/invertase (TIGR01784 family)